MNQYLIRGGRTLFGEITISGAKNAAVAIIPAALLVDGEYSTLSSLCPTVPPKKRR